MKFLSLLAIFSLAIAGSISAQSPANPDNTNTQAANAKMSAALEAPSPSPATPVEPPSLIPPNILPPPGQLPQIPPVPGLQQLLDTFKQSSLGQEADARRMHLQMAELEVQVRNDSELHQLKAAADRAHTDLERRHLLKTYYQAYYHRLRALAATPELKRYLDGQEAAHETALLQPRVRHETDEAAAADLAKLAAGNPAAAPLPTPKQVQATSKLRH